MSLNNLLGISLEAITPEPEPIQRLLNAVARNLQDAAVDTISNENRFDAAYKAVMQLANVALQANGYRTLTSKPGHHMTMLQTLNQTIGLEKPVMIQLDALRKQRNVADYSGDPVSEKAVAACIVQAHALQKTVLEWLSKNRPDLLVGS